MNVPSSRTPREPSATGAAELLLQRLLELTDRAAFALQQADGDGVLEAIAARGALFPAAESAFADVRALRDAAESAAPGDARDATLRRCDDIAELAAELQRRGARLAQDLTAAHAELARQIDALGTAPGRPSATPMRHIDLIR